MSTMDDRGDGGSEGQPRPPEARGTEARPDGLMCPECGMTRGYDKSALTVGDIHCHGWVRAGERCPGVMEPCRLIPERVMKEITAEGTKFCECGWTSLSTGVDAAHLCPLGDSGLRVVVPDRVMEQVETLLRLSQDTSTNRPDLINAEDALRESLAAMEQR